MFKKAVLKYGLKLQGRDVFKEYKKLKKLEYNSIEKNLKIQRRKLKKILYHSWKYVPYYTDVLEKSGVVLKNGKVNLKNFSKIPILNKDIVRKNFDKLKSTDPGLKKRNPYLNHSGGSSGEPVNFLSDNKTFSTGIANKWFQYSFFTDEIPVKGLFKLWGSERDFFRGGHGIKGLFKNFFYNRTFANSFTMTEDNMREYVNLINTKKPNIIEAYVDAIYELTKFIDKNNLKVYSPDGVLTSAGTLYPETRKLIEKVFKTTVINRYGSREVGDMACSCPKQEGLHLNPFLHYLEILDKNLKPVKPAETGKAFVTTLQNFSMPLIRYDIGDFITTSKKQKCSCGRGLPLIKFVEGREMSVFRTKEGKVIPGEFFIHFIGVVFNEGYISKFQAIQKDYDEIEIKVIIRDKKGFEKSKKDVVDSINKVMGGNCKIYFTEVKEIPTTKSGKYLYTISEIK